MSNSWQNLLPSKCDWCPLVCGADRASGQQGKCCADDKLYIAKAQLHFWEEPPISGTIGGPKRGYGPGSGTLFFSNCNLKCVYCQNFEISGVKNKKGKSIDIDQLVDEYLDLQNQGAMNINLVTAAHYRSHVISSLRAAKQNGLEIPIVWNSSGYESIASVYALGDLVDVWLPDFKYADNKLSHALSLNKITNYVQVALDAIEAMVELQPKCNFDTFNDNLRLVSGVVVRHMLLPGHLDNSKKALELLFQKFGNDIKYSIMNQYTPVITKDSPAGIMFPELLNTPLEQDYEDLLTFADELGIKDYYWQNGPACSESFIPTWN